MARCYGADLHLQEQPLHLCAASTPAPAPALPEEEEATVEALFVKGRLDYNKSNQRFVIEFSKSFNRADKHWNLHIFVLQAINFALSGGNLPEFLIHDTELNTFKRSPRQLQSPTGPLPLLLTCDHADTPKLNLPCSISSFGDL
eukprot:gene2462-5396_t